MNPNASWETGLNTLAPLAAQAAFVVALTALILWRLRDAVWKRTLWQACFIGVAGLVVVASLDVIQLITESRVGEPGLQAVGPVPSPGDSLPINSPEDVTLPALSEKAPYPPTLGESAGLETSAPITGSSRGNEALFRMPDPRGQTPETSQSLLTSAATKAEDAQTTTSHSTPPWWFWLGWAGGTIALIGRLMISRLSLAIFCLRNWLHFDAFLDARVQALAGRLGLRRHVRLRQTSRIRTPIAFGLSVPTIAVPADFTDRFTPREQDAMLAHELAHLAARDPLWYLLADLVCAALWWHPVVWWARAQLHSASELAADEASLLVEGGPQSLAECLVRLAGDFHGRAPLEVIGVEGDGFRSRLGKRVQRLLHLSEGESAPPGRWQTKLVRVIVPALLLVALLSATGWMLPESMRTPFNLGARWREAWDGLYAALPDRSVDVEQAFQPAGSPDFPVRSDGNTGQESPVNPQTGKSALQLWPDPRPDVVSGVVKLIGTPPPEMGIYPNFDISRFRKTPLKTRYYVVSQQGGLSDVFVYIKSGLAGRKFQTPTNAVVATAKGLEWHPYVFGVQTGQPLRFEIADPELISVHITPTIPAYEEWNRAILPGKSLEVHIDRPEMMMRIKEDVHPWMYAFACIVEHPYFAVTDEEGRFEFSQPLPAGKFTLAAVHTRAGEVTEEIEITEGQGKSVELALTVLQTHGGAKADASAIPGMPLLVKQGDNGFREVTKARQLESLRSSPTEFRQLAENRAALLQQLEEFRKSYSNYNPEMLRLLGMLDALDARLKELEIKPPAIDADKPGKGAQAPAAVQSREVAQESPVSGRTRKGVVSDVQTPATNASTTSRQAILRKMEEIRFKTLGPFDGLPLSEVVKILYEECRKMDPEKKGLNFILNPHIQGKAPAQAQEDLVNARIQVARLEDQTLAQVLDAVCKHADKPIKFIVEDYAIVFTIRVDLVTRTFRLDPKRLAARLDELVPIPNHRPADASGKFDQILTLGRLSNYLKSRVVDAEPHEADQELEPMLYLKDSRQLIIRTTPFEMERLEKLLEPMIMRAPARPGANQPKDDGNDDLKNAPKDNTNQGALEKRPQQDTQSVEFSKELSALLIDGKLLYELRLFDEAKKKLRQLLQLDPGNKSAQYYLGLVEEAQKAEKKQEGDVHSTNRVVLPVDPAALKESYHYSKTGGRREQMESRLKALQTIREGKLVFFEEGIAINSTDLLDEAFVHLSGDLQTLSGVDERRNYLLEIRKLSESDLENPSLVVKRMHLLAIEEELRKIEPLPQLSQSSDASPAVDESTAQESSEKRQIGKPDSQPFSPTPKPSTRTNAVNSSTTSRQAILQKMQQIRFKEFGPFDGLPLSEMVVYLVEECRKLDPEKKGINFILNPYLNQPDRVQGSQPQPALVGPDGRPLPSAPPASPRLDMQNVLIRMAGLQDLTLAQALDAICKLADQPIQFIVEDYAIVFTVKPDSRMFTRTFKVDPSVFMQGIQGVIQRGGVPGVNLTPNQVTQGNAGQVFQQLLSSQGANVGGNRSKPGRVQFDAAIGRITASASLADLKLIENSLGTLSTPPPQIAFRVSSARMLKDSPEDFPKVVEEVAKMIGGQAGLKPSEYREAWFALAKRHGFEIDAELGGFSRDGSPLQIKLRSGKVLEVVPKIHVDGQRIKFSASLSSGKGSPAMDMLVLGEEFGPDGPARVLLEKTESGIVLSKAFYLVTPRIVDSAGNPIRDNLETRIPMIPAKRPQIVMEARYAELPESVAKEMGLLWFTSNPIMAEFADPARSATTIARPTKGTNEVLSVDAISSMSALLTEAQQAALIRKLEQTDGVDILTAPRMLTLDQREALVSVTDITTVVVGKDEAGTLVTRELELGPKLDFISKGIVGGTDIQLDWNIKFTEFLGYDQPPKDQKNLLVLPRVRERSVKRIDTIPTGQTLLVGWGSRTDAKMMREKVPVLGDIPLLGRLFRSKKEVTLEPRHCLILLTPTLVDEAGNRIQSAK